MGFNYTVTRSGDRVCLALAGEVDVSVTERLRGAIAEIFAASDPPKWFEVDLTGLEFIDSGGIGVLIGARNGARAVDCVLYVTNPRPFVLRVLRVVGVLAALTEGAAHRQALRDGAPGTAG